MFEYFFWKFVKKTEVSFESDKTDSTAQTDSTAHEHQYNCMVISPSDLLTMRNISHKSFIENQNPQLVAAVVLGVACCL